MMLPTKINEYCTRTGDAKKKKRCRTSHLATWNNTDEGGHVAYIHIQNTPIYEGQSHFEFLLPFSTFTRVLMERVIVDRDDSC